MALKRLRSTWCTKWNSVYSNVGRLSGNSVGPRSARPTYLSIMRYWEMLSHRRPYHLKGTDALSLLMLCWECFFYAFVLSRVMSFFLSCVMSLCLVCVCVPMCTEFVCAVSVCVCTLTQLSSRLCSNKHSMVSLCSKGPVLLNLCGVLVVTEESIKLPTGCVCLQQDLMPHKAFSWAIQCRIIILGCPKQNITNLGNVGWWL